jgi:uncharacterized membrane protein
MKKLNHLKWKALLVILATFALGAVTGAALNGIYLQASHTAPELRGPSPTPILASLQRDLHLTNEQAAAIRAVIEETRRELREVRFEQCPGLVNARQHLIGRVRPLLTPAQQQRFDVIISQRQLKGDLPATGER